MKAKAETATSASRIVQLSEAVAARIAAGEVIERPASIVKELVENAIDAAATRIEITVGGGGLDLIRVSDDGEGIDPEQIELAFSRHATSKLGPAADVMAIGSLGFRGEALPSIAAVADVELVSRQRREQGGAAITYRYGQLARRGARASPPGTTVTVRWLFAHQPARLKFLRSRAAEYQQIAAVVEHYAIARPAIAFGLVIDGRSALSTSGNGDERQVLAAVYGADVARQLMPVTPHEDRAIAVRGWIAPPHLSRSNRQALSLFINGRWVQNRRLLFALGDAFQGLLPRGRHPIAVVIVQIPLEEVDVNVHPTKAEVRLRDEGRVFGALQRALRATLTEHSPAVVFEAGPGTAPPVVAGGALWAPPARLIGGSPASTLSAQVEDTAIEATTPATESAPRPARERLPLLRVLGQMGNTYLVCEGPDGMYLLDQHTAHERVIFDRLLARGEASPDVQALLVPVTVELSAPRRAALDDIAAELAVTGWQIDQLDAGALLVRALPAGLVGTDPAQTLEDFLDALVNETTMLSERRAKSLATIACHSAVRSGQTMGLDEMRALVEQLEASTEPMACPHGRPTIVHLPVELLDRQFGRSWR
ncbi:MAG: DNA mismatch repair endonuclease MutL [Dehalococcoidia bacterium]|nr:DNA mismatch repair endonuclease MutL [Dehalococcoidia bacterium]